MSGELEEKIEQALEKYEQWIGRTEDGNHEVIINVNETKTIGTVSFVLDITTEDEPNFWQDILILVETYFKD